MKLIGGEKWNCGLKGSEYGDTTVGRTTVDNAATVDSFILRLRGSPQLGGWRVSPVVPPGPIFGF